MREILCKAKMKDNNIWIEGYYYKSWGGANDTIYNIHFIHSYNMNESYEIDIDTLCQLTHMTDINGNKVWENDIVKTTNGFTLQVVWSDKYQEFMFKNLKGGYDFMIGKVYELSSVSRDKKFEVVGNVFCRK